MKKLFPKVILLKAKKKEIFTGLKNGINVELYSYEDFAADEMKACRLILENKYNVPIERKYYCSFREYLIANQKGIDLISLGYTDKYFAPELREIRKGLEKGLDVSIYDDNSKYNFEQMKIIRVGLEDGIDVSWYAKPEYDFKQMLQLKSGLESNVNISLYAKHELDDKEMESIRLELESKK